MGVTIEQAKEDRRNFELLASIKQAREKRNKTARRAFFSYLKQLFGRDK